MTEELQKRIRELETERDELKLKLDTYDELQVALIAEKVWAYFKGRVKVLTLPITVVVGVLGIFGVSEYSDYIERAAKGIAEQEARTFVQNNESVQKAINEIIQARLDQELDSRLDAFRDSLEVGSQVAVADAGEPEPAAGVTAEPPTEEPAVGTSVPPQVKSTGPAEVRDQIWIVAASSILIRDVEAERSRVLRSYAANGLIGDESFSQIKIGQANSNSLNRDVFAALIGPYESRLQANEDRRKAVENGLRPDSYVSELRRVVIMDKSAWPSWRAVND